MNTKNCGSTSQNEEMKQKRKSSLDQKILDGYIRGFNDAGSQKIT